MSASKSQQNLSNRYSGSSTNRNAKSSTKTLVVMLCAMTVLVCIVVGVMVMSKGGANSAGSYNLVVTPNNIEELKANNTETVAQGSYDVCMNSTWKFANARSASKNAFVENVLANTNTVYFTVIRNDTNQEIYTSPYITVGSRLSNIKLSDENLNAGTYPCTVVYHLVDEEYKDISTVRISISLIIEAD